MSSGPPYDILHTSRSLRIDGVVKIVLRNVAELTRNGSGEFRHHVVSLIDDDEIVGEFRALGIEPIFLGHRGAHTAARTVRRLVRLIRDRGIDLVHVNRTLDCALAGVAAKLCGVPLVSGLHWLGRIEDHPEDAGLPLWKRKFEERSPVVVSRLFPDVIVFPSDAVRQSFMSLPGFPVERRTEIVFQGVHSDANGVVEEEDAARLRSELGLDGLGPVLLNVGRLHPVKGQEFLLPMMRQVRERFPRAVLLIAGDGELRERLARDIERQRLGGAIRMLGARSDVPTLLAISDVLIISSVSEAAPLPLFEAMAAHRPVVTTRVGGVPEIVEDGVTGHIVPPGDPAALATGVLRILETPGAGARMGDAARRRLDDRFDTRASVRRFEEIYRSLIAQRSTARDRRARSEARGTRSAPRPGR